MPGPERDEDKERLLWTLRENKETESSSLGTFLSRAKDEPTSWQSAEARSVPVSWTQQVQIPKSAKSAPGFRRIVERTSFAFAGRSETSAVSFSGGTSPVSLSFELSEEHAQSSSTDQWSRTEENAHVVLSLDPTSLYKHEALLAFLKAIDPTPAAPAVEPPPAVPAPAPAVPAPVEPAVPAPAPAVEPAPAVPAPAPAVPAPAPAVPAPAPAVEPAVPAPVPAPAVEPAPAVPAPAPAVPAPAPAVPAPVPAPAVEPAPAVPAPAPAVEPAPPAPPAPAVEPAPPAPAPAVPAPVEPAPPAPAPAVEPAPAVPAPAPAVPAPAPAPAVEPAPAVPAVPAPAAVQQRPFAEDLAGFFEECYKLFDQLGVFYCVEEAWGTLSDQDRRKRTTAVSHGKKRAFQVAVDVSPASAGVGASKEKTSQQEESVEQATLLHVPNYVNDWSLPEPYKSAPLRRKYLPISQLAPLHNHLSKLGYLERFEQCLAAYVCLLF
jgi:hypothetical protein